jgi:ATP-dependent Lhr-like helicase
LLKKRLEGSGFFGARFRECAGRALLLTKQRFNERVPLWISRLRSKKLMESILGYEDFPILLETWRTCLQDEFDMDALAMVLTELESGTTSWSEARTPYPSPMARTMSWRQLNDYVYTDDTPTARKDSTIRGDLLQDLILDPGLRPLIAQDIIDRFEQKRQRLSPGYSPASERDLLDWIKERVMLPESEWNRLKHAMKRDHGEISGEWIRDAGHKMVQIRPPASNKPLILSLETAPETLNAFYGDIEKLPIKIMASHKRPVLERIEKQEAEASSNASNNVSLDALADRFHEWLQYYGPLSCKDIGTTLGIENAVIQDALEDLIDAAKVVTGQLIKEGGNEAVCDKKNFEHLLRLARAEARPEFEPLEIQDLSLFLAQHQGVVQQETKEEGLLPHVIEKLLCFPQPAHRWESDTFPARFQYYRPSWLDAVMQKGDLRWIGSENQTVAFCFESDLDLHMGEHTHTGNEKEGLPGKNASDEDNPVPENSGRYDFAALLRKTNLRPQSLADKLWQSVWKGEITNDSFMALRKGIETRYKVGDTRDLTQDRGGHRVGGRRAFSRWKNSLPFTGNWFHLPMPHLENDLMETEERNRDRVRLLLDRYGILFRELLQREAPPFQWSALFRSMRLMEYSGEIMGGYFFKGIPGLQFMSHPAFRHIQTPSKRPSPEKHVWWINATDPASLCGLPLDALREALPRRVEGNHMVYQGKNLIMISTRKGKGLTFFIPPKDPLIQSAVAPLHHMLTRAFQPLRRIVIETINGERASDSPYLDALRTSFDLSVDYRHVILYRLHSGIGDPLTMS